MRPAVLLVTVAACAKLANVQSYDLADGGGSAVPTDGSGGRSCAIWSATAGGCVSKLVAGHDRTCALAGSDLWCWGEEPGYGVAQVPTPAHIASGVVDVAVGVDTAEPSNGFGVTCFTQTNGSGSGTYCWGDDNVDQLQQVGATTGTATLVTGTVYSSIAVGNGHVCGVTPTGVECWGYDLFDQLGSGSAATCIGGPCSAMPLVSDADTNVVELAAGGAHTCARDSLGVVACWGDNELGQIGNGTQGSAVPLPAAVAQPSDNVTQIAAGELHSCMISGSAWACWGADNDDQLATGSGSAELTPMWHTGASDPFVAIAAGGASTCAVTASGAVKCWGDNNAGQSKPDDSIAEVPEPFTIEGLPAATLIAVGLDHACAMGGGQIYCWGDNAFGELGGGSSGLQPPTPVMVTPP